MACDLQPLGHFLREARAFGFPERRFFALVGSELQYFASEQAVRDGRAPLGTFTLTRASRITRLAAAGACDRSMVTIEPSPGSSRARTMRVHADSEAQASELESRICAACALLDDAPLPTAKLAAHHTQVASAQTLSLPVDLCRLHDSDASDISDYAPFDEPCGDPASATAAGGNTPNNASSRGKDVVSNGSNAGSVVETGSSHTGGRHPGSLPLDEQFAAFLAKLENNRLRRALLKAGGNAAFDVDLARTQFVAEATKETVLGVTWVAVRSLFLLDLFDKLDAVGVREWGLPVDGCMVLSSSAAEGKVEESSQLDDDIDRKDPSLFSLWTCRQGMRWAVQHIVEPATIDVQLPLLYLLFGLTIDGFQAVGPVKIFHSYTWSEPICDTLATLDKALSPIDLRFTTPVWWDIFCQNQHVKGDVAETFQRAITQVKHVYFSLPNLAQPLALGRVWCLYEVTRAILTASARLQFIHNQTTHVALAHDPMQYIRDVRAAEAFFPADKDFLINLIESEVPGGCEGVNRVILNSFAPLLLGQRLRTAVHEGSTVLVKEMLQAHPELISIKTKVGETLLHIAAEGNHVDLLTMLLVSKNINVDTQTTLLRTALHAAAMKGSAQACATLLDHGADIDAVDDGDLSPLAWAATLGKVEAAAVLLQRGADADLEDQQGETPSLAAAMTGGEMEELFRRYAGRHESSGEEGSDSEGSDGGGDDDGDDDEDG